MSPRGQFACWLCVWVRWMGTALVLWIQYSRLDCLLKLLDIKDRLLTYTTVFGEWNVCYTLSYLAIVELSIQKLTD